MSYIEPYQIRITNLFVAKEFCNYFVVTNKRAVDYDLWSRHFLSKKFDLDYRGLSDVFRTLRDRVMKVYEHPIEIERRHNNRCRADTETNIMSTYYEKVVKDSFEKAKVMVGGYLECVELLGGPKAGWVEYLRQVGFLFCLAVEDEMENYLKYQSASLCALSLGNEVDERPSVVKRGNWRVGDVLPYCKRVTFWLRKLCVKRRDPKGVQLAFSLYATKRVAPAASATFVQKALEKNLKALTEDRALPDLIRQKNAVVRTVDELFGYAMNPMLDYDVHRQCNERTPDERNKILRSRRLGCNPLRQKIPSLAACYENTRGKGGALGYLLKKFNLLKRRILVGESYLLGYVTTQDHFHEPVAVYGTLDEEEMEQLMRPSLDGYGSRVMVRREPILEPFKVRIISKGEAIPYQRAQNFQPFLWSLLQLANCFELTGRPLVDQDITGMMNWAKGTGIYSDFVSGDYTAATDNLHAWLCAHTLNRICHKWRIPFEDALNLMSCLCGHIIDDREIFSYKMNKLSGRLDEEGTDYHVMLEDKCYLQMWGQLMGSPVSFPILCIINAAITRDCMEKAYKREITLREDAFKVNGDDVVFPLPPGEYQTWVSAVTSAGLSPSIGKNYVSHRYAVINSQLYDCGKWDLENKIGPTIEKTAKKIPLLKMNLVHCQQHETTERRKDENMVIGESIKHGKTLEGRLEELVLGWDLEMRDKLLKRAYHYAKPILACLPPVSWTLPKCLGGLGLPSTRDHKVSELHLKIASLILCLDDKSRRDMVRLQWLKEPGNVFCETTNEQIAEINEDLGLVPVLADRKVEDLVYGRLIKSNLGLGIDTVIGDSKRILRAWNNIYARWVSKVSKVKWTESKDHDVKGLHAMSQERAHSFVSKVWTYSGSVVWV